MVKTKESSSSESSEDTASPPPPPAPKEVKKAVQATRKVAAKEVSESETESDSEDEEEVKPPKSSQRVNKVVKDKVVKKEREDKEKKEREEKEKKEREDKAKKDKDEKEKKDKEKEKEIVSKAARKAKKRQNVDRSNDENETKAVAPPAPPPPPPPAPAQSQQQQQQEKATDGAATDASQQPKSAAKKVLWVAKDESILAQQMLDDLKAGSDFHDKPKTDAYWEELCQSLKGRLSNDFTKEQIFDKHRRMKAKFDKYSTSKPGGRKRSTAEDALHAVFKQLWGKDVPTDATGEESNGDVEMTPAKKGGENRVADELKAALKGGDGGGGGITSDPVLTIAASVLHSIVANHKLANEVAKTGSRESRKRNLEDQIAEYSSMKRRLKLAMDYCEVEEELLEKKLSTI